MRKISLFKVGLVLMLLFVLAAVILNAISIISIAWASDRPSSIWSSCFTVVNNNRQTRDKCFREIPPALIATGTALNILSLIFILVAQLALFLPKFKDSFALYFVIGSLITTIVSLVFNSVGWYYIFMPEYQQFLDWLPGWSFWLFTPMFAMNVMAGLIGAAILGCTCVTNKRIVERKMLPQNQQVTIGNSSYIPTVGVENPNFASTTSYYYTYETNDQVLRL
jgi:hypothetical protein